jgi:hypothetical protein
MRTIVVLLLQTVFVSACIAQIGHGGKPIFGSAGMLRAATAEAPVFVMPPFDGDSAARAEEAGGTGSLRGYRFARTFATDIRKSRDFELTVLSDGTRVWRARLRSERAFSINLLLTDVHIPEGGRLFVYNAEGSHVVGSFDRRNCGESGLLPIRPVAGEEITVEYSEPAGSVFEGDFTVAQVNHDFRDMLNREPSIDISSEYACMPDVLCSGATAEMVRSSVLLIINGSVACSGVLLNNTADDGAPLLLTAVHCLNDELESGVSKDAEFYQTRAGTIVTFFNYAKPVCSEAMRGVEEMSLTEAAPRVILEKKDIALLEMREQPPIWFNAYYAGWNVATATPSGPYSNIHHPTGSVAKYCFSDKSLSVIDLLPYFFDHQSHWSLSGWTEGSTYYGSSGSPLFDGSGLVIGALSAGESECIGTEPNGKADFFSCLSKSWELESASGILKKWLDPTGKGIRQYQGLDQNVERPLFTVSNANYSGGDSLIVSLASNKLPVFARNGNGGEFAEAFETDSAIEIFGVYLYIPRQNITQAPDIDVSLYTGDSVPSQLIAKQHLSLSFSDFRTNSKTFEQQPRSLNTSALCSFVCFEEPIIVKGRYYISYRINNSTTPSFCVFNTKFADPEHPNSAFVMTADGHWIEASTDETCPPTALALLPLARKNSTDSIPQVETDKTKAVYSRTDRTITILGEDSQPTEATVFSLSGQIIEKIRFSPGARSISLSEKPTGTIGVVRIFGEKNNISLKIIY